MGITQWESHSTSPGLSFLTNATCSSPLPRAAMRITNEKWLWRAGGAHLSAQYGTQHTTSSEEGLSGPTKKKSTVRSLPRAMYVMFRSVQATQGLQPSQPGFLWSPRDGGCKSKQTRLPVVPNPKGMQCGGQSVRPASPRTGWGPRTSHPTINFKI